MSVNLAFVNRAYAQVARERAPHVKKFLMGVFGKQWPELSTNQLSEQIDAMADFMGRHVPISGYEGLSIEEAAHAAKERS